MYYFLKKVLSWDNNYQAMEASIQIQHELFQQWETEHLNEKQIEEQLIKNAYSKEQIVELLKLYQKKKLAIRTQTGLIMIGIGCFLGFISCVFTLYEVLPAMRDFILYGLTSIGISLALWGGYYVFE